MDDALEQQLRRLADEQGRDLHEVVETALRNYVVGETFADDSVFGPDHHGQRRPPATGGGAVMSGAGDGVVTDESAIVESAIVDSEIIEMLGGLPPAADSDTVIVGRVDWADGMAGPDGVARPDGD